jgi:hypothetical protein
LAQDTLSRNGGPIATNRNLISCQILENVTDWPILRFPILDKSVFPKIVFSPGVLRFAVEQKSIMPSHGTWNFDGTAAVLVRDHVIEGKGERRFAIYEVQLANPAGPPDLIFSEGGNIIKIPTRAVVSG